MMSPEQRTGFVLIAAQVVIVGLVFLAVHLGILPDPRWRSPEERAMEEQARREAAAQRGTTSTTVEESDE